MPTDYYNILGVNKNASQDEIKKAFREKAHKFHPDKQGGEEAKFKELYVAFRVLFDSTKRAQYDNSRQSKAETKTKSKSKFKTSNISSYEGPGDFSSFINDFDVHDINADGLKDILNDALSKNFDL